MDSGDVRLILLDPNEYRHLPIGVCSQIDEPITYRNVCRHLCSTYNNYFAGLVWSLVPNCSPFHTEVGRGLLSPSPLVGVL